VLHQELRAALYGMDGAPCIHGLLAGVGGVNVPVARIVAMVQDCTQHGPRLESVWAR
jgi:hypothetical protein